MAAATQQAIDGKIGVLLDQLEFQKRLKISLAEADRGEYRSAEDVFDEIELDLMLKESEEQFKRGETTTVEEMKKRTTERLNNGYYLRQFKIFSIMFSIGFSVISCSPDKKETEPEDKCEKVQYNPQTQFCFEGTVSDKGEFTDTRDGKKYRYVKIGNQDWMAENLNFSDNGSIGKCYEDVPTNCDKYGRLYFWNTAIKVCPSGWHLPSDEEWHILIDFAGGDEIAGKKLKTRENWEKDPVRGFSSGTDDYGFSALPNGYGYSMFTNLEYPSALANISYDIDIYFGAIGDLGNWWSSTESDFISSNYFDMWNSYDVVSNGKTGKLNVNAVRCVRD